MHVLILVVLVALLGGSSSGAAWAQSTGAHATGGARAGEGARPVRIMPFGDSITHGTAGDWTWRWFLDRHLRAAGLEFDLVGPQRDVYDLDGRGWPQAYADPDFDQDHAAWWGNSFPAHWRLDPGPSVLMAEHAPDVVVLAMGASDLGFWNFPAPRVLEMVEGWVLEARSVNPVVKVVLVEVPLTHLDIYAPYNASLPAAAEALSTAESPVVVAAASTNYRSSAAFDDGGDTWDWQHPNAQGSQKIAAAVADALAEIGVGAPYSRPLPEVHEGPTQVPALQLVPEPGHGDTVALRWDAVAGASAMQVEHRVEEGKWAFAGPSIDTLGSLGTRVEGLDECVTHEFRVRSVKFWTIASEKYASGPVRYRWSGRIEAPPEVTAVRRGDELLLGWPAVPHACEVGVEVQRTRNANVTVLRETLDADRYVLRAPVAGEQVEVRVTPHGVDGPGPSARVSFTEPRVKRLARVKRPRVVTRKRKVVRLRWVDVEGEHGYRVRMARGAGPWRVVRRPSADARQVRVAGLRPGTRYRFQVRAVAGGRPDGTWSRTVTVRTRR